MAKKLNSMRALDREGIDYEVLRFPDTIHSAQGVADHFQISAAQVFKTLVLMTWSSRSAGAKTRIVEFLDQRGCVVAT